LTSTPFSLSVSCADLDAEVEAGAGAEAEAGAVADGWDCTPPTFIPLRSADAVCAPVRLSLLVIRGIVKGICMNCMDT
jgi:hypothetical protein